jgi:Carboxypeptidase regulatory-like domain
MTTAKFAHHVLAAAAWLLLPSLALAQSTISGVVKDSTGSAVAGASVEVASEVLIERVRNATTSNDGRYTIIDLRPGTYLVTVTAPGFATVKQQVEVPANVSVPVDAELKVGSVRDTVTVEARVATVDVENAAHPETLTRTEMDDLPTGRYMQSIGSYVSGAHLNLPDIGGSQQIEQNYISVHGNGSVHDTYLIDGILVNTTYADGQIQQYIDNGMVQESTYQSSNVGAEVSAGGMYTNLIPKEGGNAFHGQMFAGGSSGSWQSTNVDANLIARGVTGQDAIVKITDFDGSIGGPIKKDKVWFLLTGRSQTTFTQAANSTYPNGSPGIQDGGIYAGSLRLTWQINPKNKVTIFETRNWKYKAHEILDGGQTGIPADPGTASTQRTRWPMYYIAQGKWTGTLTPTLVVEAGVSISHLDYNDLYQPNILQAPFTPQWYALTSDYDASRNSRYVAGFLNQYFQTTRNVVHGAATYIKGSHQIKVGGQWSFGPNYYSALMNGDGWNQFNNGVPLSFLAYDTPFYQRPYLKADIGVYVTDTWHYKRLSITGGVRLEYLSAKIQTEVAPVGRFVPARNFSEIDCSTVKGMGCWTTLAPRFGIVYDVFGSHKTAIKAGFGRYETPYSTGFTANFNPMSLKTETLTWNGGTAACEPTCYSVGGFTPSGTPIPTGGLGPNPNPSFGIPPNIKLDPGWKREFNLQYNIGLQQQLAKGVTLNFNWNRRSNFQATLLTNSAIPGSAWTQVNAMNPLTGGTVPIFNEAAAYVSGVSPVLYQTNAPRSLVKNIYTGYETSVVARLPRGAFLIGGWTIDRQLDRSCAASAGSATTELGNPINDPNTLRFCDMFGGVDQALGAVPSPPWQNEFKLQASYPIRYGVVASASLYSNRYQGSFTPAGSSGVVANDGYLARTWTVTKGTRYPLDCAQCPAATDTTGSAAGLKAFVDPTMGQSSETLQLVAPGQVLTPRLNQVDVGFKRVFRFRDKYVLEPEAQIFNLLNSNAAVTQATAVSTTVAPFLTGSACSANSSLKNCGVGGPVTTLTNPRILRIALMFKF